MADKSYPQHIIAVANRYFDLHNDDKTSRKPSDFINGLTFFSVQQFLAEVGPDVFIGQREALEVNPDYRQVIPYITFTTTDSDGVKRYVPYVRTPEAGEARLHGKVSIGFGGHMDAKDAIYNEKSVLDLGATILAAAEREKNEEIAAKYLNHIEELKNIPVTFADQFIYLNGTPVDAVHVAIVMNAVLPAHLEVVAGDKDLSLLPAMTGAELLAGAESGDYVLENWTRVILEAEQCANRVAEKMLVSPDDDSQVDILEITTHHVPGDRNELKIHATGGRNVAGAHNRYEISGFNGITNAYSEEGDRLSFLAIIFQDGPPSVHGENGVTIESLLAVAAHRLKGFQSGTFSCDENAIALEHIETALDALQARTRDRISRQVKDKLAA